jgi:periplasmic protein CpxP/Spy
MKKSKIIIGAVLVAVAGLVCFGFVQAYAQFSSPDERIAYVIQKITEKIALDPQQQAELENIADALKEKAAEMKAGKTQIHKQLAALARQEQLTTGELEALFAQKREQLDSMADFIGEQFVRFHAMLSPEQREKLAVAIETHQARNGHCRFSDNE